MADIAAVFHWTPETMATMTVGEIVNWRNRAVDRWNKMHAPPDRRSKP